MENEYHTSFQYIDRFQNRLVLGFSNYLYIFDKHDDKYTLTKRILLPKAVRFAKLWNIKNILIWDVYYGHHPDSWMANYDLEKQKFVIEKEPYFFHPLLQYERPYHLVDMYDQHILFAHRGKYASVIYNASLDSIQYLFMNNGEWNTLSSKHISEIKKNFRSNQARSIMDAEDKWLHKIHQQLACYWIDSTHIICFTKQPSKKNEFPNIYVDIWEFLDGEWALKIQNLQDDLVITCDPSDQINKNSFSIGFLANQATHFFPNRIACFKSSGTTVNPIGLNRTAYYQNLKSYYSENNSIVQIYIFSHTFNDKQAK